MSTGARPCRPAFSLWQMRARLRTYGAAGLLSYGLLNCVYYTVAFLAVYCWVGQKPAGEQRQGICLFSDLGHMWIEVMHT